MSVAVFGTGLIGSNIARRLLERGFRVSVWNRSYEKAASLGQFGARVTKSIREALEGAEIASINVSDDNASLYVLENILNNLGNDLVVVNHSTVTPLHSRRAYEMSTRKNCPYIALPIMGGPKEAMSGDLVGIAGGDYDKLVTHKDYIDALFRKVHVVGSPEEASAVKLAINSVYFSAMIGLAEALVLAEGWGVSPEKFFEIGQDLWIKSIIERYGSRLIVAGSEKGISLPHISSMAQLLLSASMRKAISEEDYTRVYKFLKGLV
ncbi:hypothetical protein MA03_01095 [Infirmifilum uzonense]|uniref:6-phosphogluconate dehydrogenase NADP-binding domain-containing protein n=1 Tax=Infirmifilum uzonense TaxID=1550241 RepID=A0A0F7CKS3_9CREN|nr:NAD(P)-dependent oxidoreductase [Infirmifilum uzonense]AKG38161.1 hypothetical protein MA03_01095 [Infirmifilum uzonense]